MERAEKSSEASAEISLNSFPVDMIFVILGFVEVYDISSVARVCRQWRKISLIPSVRDAMMFETKKSILRGDSGGYSSLIRL